MNCQQYQEKLQEDSAASAEAMQTKRQLDVSTSIIFIIGGPKNSPRTNLSSR